MGTPGISIVIPSFNQGLYIERTLLSILKQDFKGEVEIIVSDGGSTDNTKEILKKYDKQITWWSEKDSGYADAVNKGFRKASGEIFAIQSSDDYYLQGVFTEIIESFKRHPDASLICGREVLQNYDGSVFGGYLLPDVITPKSFLLDHPFPGIFQHTTFFHRKFYEKVRGMRSEFDMCADADLFYRMLHLSHGYFLDTYTAVYQKHESQRTRTQTLKFESQLIEMVLSCRNDPFYNDLYELTDDDFSLFRTFIDLFYLQYDNLQKAQIKAMEVVNNSAIDERTKKLAQQIIDTKELRKRKLSFEVFNKALRIANHLFTKYIANNKERFPKENANSFREVIEPDWWQK